MRAFFTVFTGLILLALAACAPQPPSTPQPASGQPAGGAAPTRPLPTPTVSIPDSAAPEPTIPVVEPVPVQPQPIPAQRRPTPVPGGSLDEINTFLQGLENSVESRKFGAFPILMGPRFSIATFNRSLYEYAAAEAVAQLQAGPLAGGSAPVLRWNTDVSALLNGADPLSLWGPNASAIRAVHVTGLGAQGNQEAVLVVGRSSASGAYTWHGILLPENGASFTRPNTPADVIPTGVTAVSANADLEVRPGPGYNYPSEGLVRAGEIAQVTGKSSDDLWWQIACTNNNTGRCWIPADPALTTPVTQPSGDAVPTDVQMVRANDALRVRSGPGTHYAVEGFMREGETAQVTGKSSDGGWWQIVCTTDISGRCWVSADPELTTPVGLP